MKPLTQSRLHDCSRISFFMRCAFEFLALFDVQACSFLLRPQLRVTVELFGPLLCVPFERPRPRLVIILSPILTG